MRPVTLSGFADRLDVALMSGGTTTRRPLPTGFPVLDEVVGGLRPGTLTLVAGPPAIGKTILALQWARNVAAAGHHALYVSFEHDVRELFVRAIGTELSAGEGLDTVARRLLGGETCREGLAGLFDSAETADTVATALADHGRRLRLASALGRDTTVDAVEALLDDEGSDFHDTDRDTDDGGLGADCPLVVVDYLQKLAVGDRDRPEAERITSAVEALKDLALRADLPVVCLAAADTDGLRSARVRLHHLRGSSALAYECDLALILNDKATAVSPVHLDYDPVRAATFEDWVVLTVEKNRSGPTPVHLEFRKDFSRFRFNPRGGVVTERLAD